MTDYHKHLTSSIEYKIKYYFTIIEIKVRFQGVPHTITTKYTKVDSFITDDALIII